MSDLVLLSGFLFLILIVLALVIRFFYWQIDQEMKDLARLETDAEYRAGILAKLDERIAGEPTNPTLRKRRADVRRLAGQHAGVVEDLTVFLEARAEDDSGWAELAESHLALQRPAEALRAAEHAAELDPECLEHYPLRLRAALLARDLAAGRDILDLWEQVEDEKRQAEQERREPRMIGKDFVPPFDGDPLLPLFRAALALADDRQADAERELRELQAQGPGAAIDLDALRNDPALAPLLPLLAAEADGGGAP